MSECCKSCGSYDLNVTLMNHGPHYSRVDCKDCGEFVKWGKKTSEAASNGKKYKGGNGMNLVSLMGRLTKDPEVRYTQNNTAVCNFTLAVDRDFVAEGQERQADFISCIVWQKKGEAAGKYLEKGRRVAVAGRIQTRTWDDDNGKRHYVTEVVANNWYFADDKRKESNGANGQSAPPPQQQTHAQSGNQGTKKHPWE